MTKLHIKYYKAKSCFIARRGFGDKYATEGKTLGDAEYNYLAKEKIREHNIWTCK